MSTEQIYWGQMYANAIDASIILHKPSSIFKPKISLDGNAWCALYGENLQDGVAGFGKSPEEAMADFDRIWKQRHD